MPGLLATISERPPGLLMLSLFRGRNVALPPPFFLSHAMHLAATSSSLTTMLLRPPPNAIPLISPLCLSLAKAASVIADPGLFVLSSWRARARLNSRSDSLTLASDLSLSAASSDSCFCKRRSSSARDVLSSPGLSLWRSSPTSSKSSRTIVASSNISSRSASLLEDICSACSALSASNLFSA